MLLLQEVTQTGTRDPNSAHQGHYPPVVLWSYALQGFTAALSPRREPCSPTTHLEGGCFVSAFTLVSSSTPPWLKKKVRGPGRRAVPGTKAQAMLNHTTYQAQKKQKHRVALPWRP